MTPNLEAELMRRVHDGEFSRVVFGEAYRLDEKVTRFAAELGIELAPLERTTEPFAGGR
ncbi:hypothetical protein [Sorangium sp. So ce124]|uniref:hypothetical protein n=1 Tax=Sorangium sp. So ce124 TaxID=3133280 RepID=UPI003F60B875